MKIFYQFILAVVYPAEKINGFRKNSLCGEIRNYNQIAWFYRLPCLIWLKQSIVIDILTFTQVKKTTMVIINLYIG